MLNRASLNKTLRFFIDKGSGKEDSIIMENKKNITNIIFASLLLIPIFLLVYIFFYIMSKQTTEYGGTPSAVPSSQESSTGEDNQYWQKVQSQETDLRKTGNMSFEQTTHETQRQLDNLELKRDLRRYSNTLSDTLY